MLCSTDSISASCSYYATVREKIMLYSLISSMQLRIIIVVWLGAHQQLKEKNTQKCPNISTLTLRIKYLLYPVSILYTQKLVFHFSKSSLLCLWIFLSFMHSLHSLIRYIHEHSYVYIPTFFVFSIKRYTVFISLFDITLLPFFHFYKVSCLF